MSYKPFASIDLVKQYYDRAAKGSRNAFLALETALKSLELPECDTIQVKNIVYNDAVDISDDGNLTIYGGDVKHALVCTGTFGASALAAQILDLHAPVPEYIDFFLQFRVDAAITTDKVLYRRDDGADDVIYFDIGINGTSQEIYCYLGGGDNYIATWPLGDLAYFVIGDWHDLMIHLNYADMKISCELDGFLSPEVTFAWGPAYPTTTDRVLVGCAGISLSHVAVIACPLGKSTFFGRRPIKSLNYYNFAPSVSNSLLIPDLTLNNDQLTNLTVDPEKATLEQVEVI